MTDDPGALPPQSAYLIQYGRAHLLLRRLDRRTAPNLQAAITAISNYDLDVVAFFTICWHIRDWVKNDDTIPWATREAVDQSVFATPLLLACHDIANGAKHYLLKGAKYVQQDDRLDIANIDFRQPEDGWGDGLHSWAFSYVFPDHTEHYAHELARETMRAWDAVLNAHSLGTPGTDAAP